MSEFESANAIIAEALRDAQSRRLKRIAKARAAAPSEDTSELSEGEFRTHLRRTFGVDPS